MATGSGSLVVDLTAWGWVLLIWGLVLVRVGLALLGGRGWARWFTIVVVSLNIIVLYALAVRWDGDGTAATG